MTESVCHCAPPALASSSASSSASTIAPTSVRCGSSRQPVRTAQKRARHALMLRSQLAVCRARQALTRSERDRVGAAPPGGDSQGASEHPAACTRSGEARLARNLLRTRCRTAIECDRGAVTAEYAIVIMAAVAFAGLLVAIMGSGEVRAALVRLVEQALQAGG